MLYVLNTFQFNNQYPLQPLSRKLLRYRWELIRTVHLTYYFNPYAPPNTLGSVATWISTCETLATLTGLRKLCVCPFVALFGSLLTKYVNYALSPLMDVNVDGEFEVYLSWAEHEEEGKFPVENRPFNVIRMTQHAITIHDLYLYRCLQR